MIINGVPMIARSSTYVILQRIAVSALKFHVRSGSPDLAAGQLLANVDTGTARGM